MNMKICKACGQTNFPDATACSNCSLNLPTALSNAGGQAQVKPEKSNKMYWILGGIGAVVLIGGFFIVAIAAGIYFYSSQEVAVVENTNAQPFANNSSEKETKNDDKTTDKSKAANLKEYIENNYKGLGDFKLITVSELTDKSKKVFPSSKDEAFAIYSSDKKNPLEIMFSIANFRTVSEAKDDVEAIKKKTLAAKKGKIIKESKLSDGVIITSQRNRIIEILDCKDRLCATVSGIDGTKVADFYKKINAK